MIIKKTADTLTRGWVSRRSRALSEDAIGDLRKGSRKGNAVVNDT